MKEILHSWFETGTPQSATIYSLEFIINLLLAALLAFILSRIYIRFGSALSNRELFGRNFVLISMTTMVIITIVKSSLELSLGLVGALSIVRFRAAIKEPEELSFLFLAIAIGLGFGANQPAITIIAFLIIVGVVSIKRFVRKPEAHPNYYLTISCPGPEKIGLQKIQEVLKRHTTAASLKRFDETEEVIEAAFQTHFSTLSKIEACTEDFKAISSSSRISFIDDKGIIS
jgi:uncharacterized membrane protein YhiD involved in acid resistance